MRRPRRGGARRAPDGDAARVNVLAVHTATQPPLGADTWVHTRLLRHLDRSTHTVHAACVRARDGQLTPTFTELSSIDDLSLLFVNLGPERSYEPGGPSTVRTALATLPAIPGVIRLARYIRTHDISILHTSDRPRDALVCVLLSKATRAKSILHVHVLHNDWMGRVLRWSIANADARVAVSDFVRSTLDTADPGLHHSYTVLNAIDPSEWAPEQHPDTTATRRSMGVDDDALLVLTVCRLFEEKGVRRLIHAIAAVRDEFPQVRLRVAGIDTTSGEPHLALLRDTVTDLGLDDHVEFLGRRSDVPALMAAADIFAMPSHEEPFGLVFAEAMASELPVIALDNGGTVEVVQHERHGLLSHTDDADALAGHVRRLLGDPELRGTMGRAGREHVRAAFTLERQAAEMAYVYRLVASNSAIDSE